MLLSIIAAARGPVRVAVLLLLLVERHAIIAAAHGPVRVAVLLLLLVEKTCYYYRCSWTRPRRTPVRPPPPPIGGKDMLLLPLLVDPPA
jgi:hypothetical protein